MTGHAAIQQLVNDWLPKAERWVEQERDNTIESLLLCYQSNNVQSETAWANLPTFYQQRFDRSQASMQRVADGRVLHIATHGDLTSWRSLFKACGKIARSFVKLDLEGKAFETLDNFEWWVFLNFTYSQCNVLDCEVGGKRRNLDRSFQIQINGEELKDSFFYVDDEQPGVKQEFLDALKQSAKDYGYFATISDLRLSTIASIKWMRDLANRSTDENEQARKRRGPYLLPPINRQWADVVTHAKLRFEWETQQKDWDLSICLHKLGRMWFEIVSFDHDSDHYTKFADNIESIMLYYYESRRLWNEYKATWPRIEGFEFFKIPCDSVADGAIEFFDMVVVDVLDDVRGQVRLTNEKFADQDWAADFWERLIKLLNRVGIADKPLDALQLLKRIEREIPNENRQAKRDRAQSTLSEPSESKEVATDDKPPKNPRGAGRKTKQLTPIEKKIFSAIATKNYPMHCDVDKALGLPLGTTAKAVEAKRKRDERAAKRAK